MNRRPGSSTRFRQDDAGTSALFVTGTRPVRDQTLIAFRDVGAELVSTNLSKAQEKASKGSPRGASNVV
jgi:uncharacterized membrane protein